MRAYSDNHRANDANTARTQKWHLKRFGDSEECTRQCRAERTDRQELGIVTACRVVKSGIHECSIRRCGKCVPACLAARLCTHQNVLRRQLSWVTVAPYTEYDHAGQPM
jgi:hypothetical protein